MRHAIRFLMIVALLSAWTYSLPAQTAGQNPPRASSAQEQSKATFASVISVGSRIRLRSSALQGQPRGLVVGPESARWDSRSRCRSDEVSTDVHVHAHVHVYVDGGPGNV